MESNRQSVIVAQRQHSARSSAAPGTLSPLLVGQEEGSFLKRAYKPNFFRPVCGWRERTKGDSN